MENPDGQLIEFRTQQVIDSLTGEIHDRLQDQALQEAFAVLGSLHTWRVACHGGEPELEITHPDGAWGHLAEMCEKASWVLARLEFTPIGEHRAVNATLGEFGSIADDAWGDEQDGDGSERDP